MLDKHDKINIYVHQWWIHGEGSGGFNTPFFPEEYKNSLGKIAKIVNNIVFTQTPPFFLSLGSTSVHGLLIAILL